MSVRHLVKVLLTLLLVGVGIILFATALRQPAVQRNLGIRPTPRTIYDQLAYAAEDIVDPSIIYDPAYRQLAYPGGDVPADRGVCADVLVRAYRKLDIDLQVLVHEDMSAHFSAYPRQWGLRRPDRNIDHRRVYNLATFFTRHGIKLAVSTRADEYRPGDIVVWRVANQGHIGIVSSRRERRSQRPLIVHNIGAGQVIEDMLFDYPILGHYRYPRETATHQE